MLAAFRAPGMGWRRHLKWACDVLSAVDHTGLSDIPALMLVAAGVLRPD
jgi:hypothetical protein